MPVMEEQTQKRSQRVVNNRSISVKLWTSCEPASVNNTNNIDGSLADDRFIEALLCNCYYCNLYGPASAARPGPARPGPLHSRPGPARPVTYFLLSRLGPARPAGRPARADLWFTRQTVPDCRASWAEAARPISLRESSRYNDLAAVCGPQVTLSRNVGRGCKHLREIRRGRLMDTVESEDSHLVQNPLSNIIICLISTSFKCWVDWSKMSTRKLKYLIVFFLIIGRAGQIQINIFNITQTYNDFGYLSQQTLWNLYATI